MSGYPQLGAGAQPCSLEAQAAVLDLAASRICGRAPTALPLITHTLWAARRGCGHPWGRGAQGSSRGSCAFGGGPREGARSKGNEAAASAAPRRLRGSAGEPGHLAPIPHPDGLGPQGVNHAHLPHLGALGDPLGSELARRASTPRLLKRCATELSTSRPAPGGDTPRRLGITLRELWWWPKVRGDVSGSSPGRPLWHQEACVAPECFCGTRRLSWAEAGRPSRPYGEPAVWKWLLGKVAAKEKYSPY